MNCDAIREQLSAHLDGELSAREAERVREHLASCEACRKELASLEELTGVLRALPRHKAPGEIEREVVAYIERDLLLREPTRSHGRAVIKKALGAVTLAAASALIAVGVYVQFHRGESAPLTEGGARGYFAGEKREADDYSGLRRFKKGADGRDAPRDAIDKTYSLGLRNGDTGVVQSFAEAASQAVQTLPEKERLSHAGEATVPGPAVAKILERPTAEVGAVVEFDAKRPAGRLAGVRGGQAPPAEPEVFEVVLAADDFESARSHIVAVAASLGVHPVEMGRSFEYRGKGARVLARGRTTEFWADRWRGDGTTYGKVAGRAGAEPGKPEENRLAAVLAVDEDKLPQLVARLVAQRPRFRGDGYAGDRPGRPGQSGEGEATTEVTHAKALPSRRPEDTDALETKLAEARRRGDPRPKPDETVRQEGQVMQTEDLSRAVQREVPARVRSVVPDGKEKAGEPAVPKDEAEKLPAATAPLTVARDLKKTLADEDLKQKPQKEIREVRLVYVRVYLTVPKTAGTEAVPAAEPTPATKD